MSGKRWTALRFTIPDRIHGVWLHVLSTLPENAHQRYVCWNNDAEKVVKFVDNQPHVALDFISACFDYFFGGLAHDVIAGPVPLM